MYINNRSGTILTILLVLTASAQKSIAIDHLYGASNQSILIAKGAEKSPNQSLSLPSDTTIKANRTHDQGLYESTKILSAQTVTAKNTVTSDALVAAIQAKTDAGLWQRIFSMYAIPEVNAKRRVIQYEIRWLQNHEGYVRRVQQRAQPFFYEIVSQIQTAGLPGEIALLPIVESAFRPHAYSRGRASGIWQFTRGTAIRFGLGIHSGYDGRRDIYASTQAAIRYLGKLHRQFKGDWLLALAAYNSGEGTVAKAIRRNRKLGKTTDFWHLRLPKETRSYVPRLLAVAEAFRHSNKYGIELLAIEDRPLVEAIAVDGPIDLAVTAKNSGMTLDKLRYLNPGFSHRVTPSKRSYTLLVPIEQADVFRTGIAVFDKTREKDYPRHIVESGETLGEIALNYGTSTAEIQSLNNIDGHIIHPGKKLLIPVDHIVIPAVKTMPTRPTIMTPKIPTAGPENSEKILYTVLSGDSLWEIARKYYVTVKDLKRWNRLTSRSILRPGKMLVVWVPNVLTDTENHAERIEQPDPFDGLNYTVKKGDSLYVISRRFNVKIADLRRWNATTLGKYLKPGQKLIVRMAEAEPTTL